MREITITLTTQEARVLAQALVGPLSVAKSNERDARAGSAAGEAAADRRRYLSGLRQKLVSRIDQASRA